MSALRSVAGHRFVVDDVSIVDDDVPRIAGHRQVTDAQVVTLASRNGMHLVTYGVGVLALAGEDDVELLAAL